MPVRYPGVETLQAALAVTEPPAPRYGSLELRDPQLLDLLGHSGQVGHVRQLHRRHPFPRRAVARNPTSEAPSVVLALGGAGNSERPMELRASGTRVTAPLHAVRDLDQSSIQTIEPAPQDRFPPGYSRSITKAFASRTRPASV